MNLKKMTYTLVSTLMLSAFFSGIAKAIPMQDVFDEIVQKMKPEKQVSCYILKLQSYLKETIPETKPTLTGLDAIGMIRRKDSIAFGLFCCMCYKKNWTNYVRYAAERRDINDRREDIEVLETIFPDSVSGPDGLLALCGRLEINPDEIIMDSYDRAQLIAFVSIAPPFESEEKEEDYHPESESEEECEKRKRSRFQKKSLLVDVVEDSADTTIEAVSSPRLQRKQKRLETVTRDLDGSEKQFKSRRKRNKPHCLSTIRDNSRRFEGLDGEY